MISIKMKIIWALLLLVTGAQALQWNSIRPIVSKNSEHKLRNVHNSGRIVGGNEATPGQFPYQVGLVLEGAGVCGATLISETIILSAAHCLANFPFIEVNFGAFNIYDYEEPGRITVTTTDIHVHENYHLLTVANDIGFLRLPEPVSPSPNIEIMRLPSRSQEFETFEGISCTVSGWGVFDTSDPQVSPYLNYAEMSVVSNAECSLYYNPPLTIIRDYMLCAVGVTGNICNSDSGGPLVVKESDGINTQIGIVSFGLDCDSLDPSGFTRITSFFDWIETNTGVNIRP